MNPPTQSFGSTPPEELDLGDLSAQTKRGFHVSEACRRCQRLKVKCSGIIPCKRCMDSGRAAECQPGKPDMRKTINRSPTLFEEGASDWPGALHSTSAPPMATGSHPSGFGRSHSSSSAPDLHYPAAHYHPDLVSAEESESVELAPNYPHVYPTQPPAALLDSNLPDFHQNVYQGLLPSSAQGYAPTSPSSALFPQFAATSFATPLARYQNVVSTQGVVGGRSYPPSGQLLWDYSTDPVHGTTSNHPSAMPSNDDEEDVWSGFDPGEDYEERSSWEASQSM